MNKSSFVRGAAILGIAGLIGKIIGAFYRIPLTNIIGPEGMGIYQIAYPIYAFLVVISTSGLPTAISKMVSEKIAIGDAVGAHRIFRISWRILAAIGLASTVLVLLGNRLIAEWIGNGKASLAIAGVAPALFFVAILSSYRGYFQGMQMMSPTAVSQLVEQLGKLIIGFSLAYRWRHMGVEYGAFGALVGVAMSELASLVLLMGVYHRKRKWIQQGIVQSGKTQPQERTLSIAVMLARIAVPVTLGAAVMPLVGFLDTAIVIKRLCSIGFDVDQATALFADLTAMVNPLINMPAVLTVALAIGLVPSIAQSYALRDGAAVRQKAKTGLRLALLTGLPAAAGLFLLAGPIIELLYRSVPSEHLEVATRLLQLMAAAVVFLSIVQTLTGVLQGIGRTMIPVWNLLVGAVLKVITSYVLIGIPSIHIYGAAIGTMICYAAAALLNLLAVQREIGMDLDGFDLIIKPVLSAAGMTIVVYLVDRWTGKLMLSIAAGMCSYFMLLLATGALVREDIRQLPGGRKIEKGMGTLGIWK